MLAGVLLQQRGRRGARAAAAWALGDDGPLYCLARRGGVWRKRGGAETLVAWPAASSGAHATRLASAGERMARACLAR